VVYGLPTDEAMEAHRRGDIVLAGCVEGTERWACVKCARRFWSMRDEIGGHHTRSAQQHAGDSSM